MNLQPLLNNLRISLFISCSPNDSITHNPQSAIIPPIIPSFKELCNLLLRLPITELPQTHLQEPIKHDHVSTQSFLQRLEVLLDVFPERSAGLGVCRESSGARVDILGRYLSEEERKVVWKEGEILYSTKGTESDFFAIYGRCGGPFRFDSVVLRLASVFDGDGIDCGAEIWVDGGFVFAGDVEVEAAFAFSDYSAID